ncbi:GLPGLI family protein [uncultured Aquimarina sp.]|uniref:GLPGLI family protein n=1 Tax=uncultured Aquimarina sp. TaxID=575652 RepID=UPI00263215DD|nr:GLPGLI family protein [uncultured Aquimarina sp.]
MKLSKQSKNSLGLKSMAFVFSLIISSTFAQKKYYSIEYEHTDINGYSCSSELMIYNDEAIFKINDKREGGITSSANGQMYYANTDELSTFTYSNTKETFIRTLYKKRELVYKYSSDHLEWTITENSKKIGIYNCIQALATFHGRNYEVWFTLEVPINYGPLRLNGLPGLVVEATTDKGFFVSKLISIKTNKSVNQMFSFSKDFFKKQEKKVQKYEDYEKIMTETMIRRKLKMISIFNEDGGTATLSFDEDQNAFTRYIIDIPENAIKELQKIN